MDRSEMTREQRATAVASNNLWLQDAMAVLLVLLVLDRFADYHNDSATAPVRETAAQALAVAAAASPQAVRQQLLEQLINLQLCEVWEVRGQTMFLFITLDSIAGLSCTLQCCDPRICPQCVCWCAHTVHPAAFSAWLGVGKAWQHDVH